jgi:hypothetical protein
MANIQTAGSFTYPLDWNINKLEVSVNSFPLFPDTVEALWNLSGDNQTFSGSMIIPHNIVLQWGTDDTILEDYVISQLNLERSVELPPLEISPTIEETPPTEPIV